MRWHIKPSPGLCLVQWGEDGGKHAYMCGKILKGREDAIESEERIGMQHKKGKYHRKQKLEKTL